MGGGGDTEGVGGRTFEMAAGATYSPLTEEVAPGFPEFLDISD